MSGSTHECQATSALAVDGRKAADADAMVSRVRALVAESPPLGRRGAGSGQPAINQL